MSECCLLRPGVSFELALTTYSGGLLPDAQRLAVEALGDVLEAEMLAGL